MTVMPIYVAPHPVLKKKAEKVENVDNDLRRLMDDMLETMYENDGIGLAAPQVGVLKRVVVMDLEQNADESGNKQARRGKPLFFVNPEVVWSSEDLRVYNEGCLSVPAQYADVVRPDKVRINYIDYNGKHVAAEADGLFATAIQHEIDHLNGVLFIDHLSSLKRSIIIRKLQKFLKTNSEEMAESHIII